MAEKSVRICDRCGLERTYFATVDLVVVKIVAPRFEGQTAEKAHDLCGPCEIALNTFLRNSETDSETGGVS